MVHSNHVMTVAIRYWLGTNYTFSQTWKKKKQIKNKKEYIIKICLKRRTLWQIETKSARIQQDLWRVIILKLSYPVIFNGHRERKREKERKRERETERQRDRERETERETEREVCMKENTKKIITIFSNCKWWKKKNKDKNEEEETN